MYYNTVLKEITNKRHKMFNKMQVLRKISKNKLEYLVILKVYHVLTFKNGYVWTEIKNIVAKNKKELICK